MREDEKFSRPLASSIGPQRYILREAHLNILVFYHLPKRRARIHDAKVLLLPRAIETVEATHHLIFVLKQYGRRSISRCMEFLYRVERGDIRYMLHTGNLFHCHTNRKFLL